MDAFWNVPLAKKERRWFAFILRGVYYLFSRAAQGSRGAPLAWARAMAFATRFAQACCNKATTRINVYVDDPILAIIGSVEVQHHEFAKVFLIWMAMGFEMAWPKAQFGAEVTWTSAMIRTSSDAIHQMVKKARVDDVEAETKRLRN